MNAGLRWSEFDFLAGSLQVQRIVVEANGKLIVQPPKTKSGRRSVPIAGFALEALRVHRAKQTAPPHPTAWVFCNRNGGPLRKGNFFKEHWKPLREAVGVPTARFHDLRHTTASLLLKRGVHPKVVQSILGHARFGLTMDLYSHLMDGAHGEAAAAMDGLPRVGVGVSALVESVLALLSPALALGAVEPGPYPTASLPNTPSRRRTRERPLSFRSLRTPSASGYAPRAPLGEVSPAYGPHDSVRPFG